VTWERDAEETARFSAELAPEWLVTDHYGLDARWEERLSPPSGKVLVVDDLADRRHACRLLLDQGYRAGGGDPYGPLVPPGCRRLLGPRFALLRPEFAEARRTARERDGSVRRILVFLGGADPRDATGTVLEGVGAAALPGVQVDAVVGGAYAHREKAARFCASRPGWRLHVQTSEMAALMAAADLAVGGGGTATWERCFLGLPALAAVLADNQEGITAAVAAAGAQVDLGRIDALTPERVAREVEALASDPERLRTMGRAASALLPPESFEGADGVVRAMEEA
jgi:UDP-2,4-diacetamido-2,4,6-trideoxy-beta-L-altropyranose hydrolase